MQSNKCIIALSSYTQFPLLCIYSNNTVICVKESLEELQLHGILPNKDYVVLTAENEDGGLSFEDDWNLLIAATVGRDMNDDRILVGVKAAMLPLWEMRKLVALIHDKKPEDVVAMADLHKLIIDKPASFAALHDFFRIANKRHDAVVLRHSRDFWRILCNGQDALEQILLRRCHACLQFGHVQRYCWMTTAIRKTARTMELWKPQPKSVAHANSRGHTQQPHMWMTGPSGRLT